MKRVRFLHFGKPDEVIHEMQRIGVDPLGIESMREKIFHLNLKIQGIDCRLANLLKQEMVILGGDVAMDKRIIDCSVAASDLILMGTQNQIKALTDRLEDRFNGFQGVAVRIRECLKNLESPPHTIRCKKTVFHLDERTHLMGILNVTPDSFSDGEMFFAPDKAISHGIELASQGADIIDIGGESTRPGAKPLARDEELRRVIPVIEGLAAKVDVPISIDTYKSFIAEKAIEAGAEMINDISGLHFDPKMADVAAKYDVPIVLMHTKGTPEVMQLDVHYDCLLTEIMEYLEESIEVAEGAGVDAKQIIIDPGIGFGKSAEDNLRIIYHLAELKSLGKPIMLGTSRKSFIGKILDAEVDQRVEGTLASISAAIMNGANILRVHDVGPARKAAQIVDAILRG
ncbi:MAG: dihydropteroate synthase [Thermodesulfobacteriota bacterium]